MEMLRSVFVLGRIAAPHVAAGHAETQMDPSVSGLQALLATPGIRRNIPNLVKMRTGIPQDLLLLLGRSSRGLRLGDGQIDLESGITGF